MAEPQQQLGRLGEDMAIQCLQAQGYRILARNFRCRFGEIDLIARDGHVLAFIEVKTRRSGAFGPAAGAVTLQKQRHIIKVAQVYLASMKKPREICRFDVVTIEMETHQPRVEVIKNAFQSTVSMG